MLKDIVMTIRINSKLKKEAEAILSKLGLNSSTAITLFYKNIVLNKGIPFKLQLDSVPDMNDKEQKETEKILRKRTKADKEIAYTENKEIAL